MKHTDEIKEIREMINSISNTNTYAKSLDDEELGECVTYLYTKDTGLSKDIIVDSGISYKHYNHPLCVYVVDGENVFPVVVDQTPYAPFGQQVSPDILMFIQHFSNVLKKFADMDIDGGDFFDAIEPYCNNLLQQSRMVVEMSNYGPNKT